MEIKFGNKRLNLKKLENNKITEIINNVAKKHEDNLKKHLNETQIQNFIKDNSIICQKEINDKIYENTLQLLINQYESFCKPIIYNELKAQVESDCKTKFENELKAQVESDCKTKFENELKAQIEKMCKTKFENELKAQIEKMCKTKFENELKAKIEKMCKTKFENELKAQIEKMCKTKFENELKAQIETVNKSNHKNNKTPDNKNMKHYNVPQFTNDMLKGLLTYSLNNEKK